MCWLPCWRFIFIVSFDRVPHSSVLQMRKSKWQSQGLTPQPGSRAGATTQSWRVSALCFSASLQCGQEANRGAFGSGYLEGLLRPNCSLLPEALIMRKGVGWEEPPDAARGHTSQRSDPTQTSSPSLPMLSALTSPPSAPWACRRSTWRPQSSQWSRRP